MPEQIEKEIVLPDGKKIYSSMGSVMHGALMETLPAAFVASVHEQGLRPYSENIYWDKERQKAIWQLNILNDRAASVLKPVVKDLSELELKQRGYKVQLTDLKNKIESYSELADAMFLRDVTPKGAYLNFITATSFKRNGQYVNFPDIFLIINSLLNRWNKFTENIPLHEDRLAINLAEMCKIDRYQLQSQNFSLEKQVIQGFAGTIRIRFFAGDMQRRLLGLLLCYANYAGIGIKTALGMGGTEVEIF